LNGNIGFTLHIDVDGNEVILAVDLQAVAGIKHQGNGIGTLGCQLPREFADLLAQLVLR